MPLDFIQSRDWVNSMKSYLYHNSKRIRKSRRGQWTLEKSQNLASDDDIQSTRTKENQNQSKEANEISMEKSLRIESMKHRE